MDAESGAPLASFEGKWTAAHPEFGAALAFVAPAERNAQSAFACLAFELEHAAFALRDAEPAAIKLQWWAEELARAVRGEARHPLTRTLAAHAPFAGVPQARWFEVVRGALAQRDADPAADRTRLLDGYAELYRPLALIESGLFAGVDAEAGARASALSRAVHETANLADALRAGRLPLPLDLLAQHRLARGSIAQASPTQVAALQQWLGELAREFDALRGARVGALRSAAAAADRVRARASARAAEPVVALSAARARLPLAAIWAAWRGARRARA